MVSILPSAPVTKSGYSLSYGKNSFVNYSDSKNPLKSKKITIPSGLGWNNIKYPLINSALTNAGYISFKPNGEPLVNTGYDVRSYLGMIHPTWQTWQTFYVDPTQPTNGTGTLASPFNTYGNAVIAANATGLPAIVRCKGGSSSLAYCNRNFSNNGNVYPTVDIVWIAYGGKCTVTTHQMYLTWFPENCTAIATASIAANSFSGYISLVTTGGVSRQTLTVTSITTGMVCEGMTITGGTTAAGTVILRQLTSSSTTMPAGGPGTYLISVTQANVGSAGSPQAFTGDGGCMTVTAIADNAELEVGMTTRNSSASGMKILGFGNNGSAPATGGIGNYWVSSSTTLASTSIVFDGTGPNKLWRTEKNGIAQVVDLTTRTVEGLYPYFTVVNSKAQCKKTPNSVYYNTTTGVGYTVINRADGNMPSEANTRCYLATDNLYLKGTTQTTCVLLGETSNDGFELEGGSAACFRAAFTGGSNGRTVNGLGVVVDGTGVNPTKIVGAENSSFRYSGARVGSGAVGNVAIEGLEGLAVFYNCDASYGATDCWNFHNALGANMYALTVYCTGNNAGQIYGYVSCNGWTSHDTVIAIDILGKYDQNRGNTMHSIGYTRQLWICPQADRSVGDIVNGGANYPGGEYKIEDNGIVWLYSPYLRRWTSSKPKIRVEGYGTMNLCATGDLYTSESYVAAGTATLSYWNM